jgi:ABC-2 type transport system permease protein
MTRAVYEIAKQEFTRILVHPITLFTALILIILVLLNVMGEARQIQGTSIGSQPSWDTTVSWFSSSWWAISVVCTMIAVFIGATSIPYERWNHSVSVLISKPLYMWDFVLGKFLGLSMFMLVFNTSVLLFISLMTIIFLKPPQSELEFAWRLIAYIFVMTLSCSLIIALNMFFGIISKNILVVTSASIIYIFFDWIWRIGDLIGNLSMFTPVQLYHSLICPFIIAGEPFPLFDTLVSFDRWFYAVLPLLAIIFIEISALLLAGIFLFSREDSV